MKMREAVRVFLDNRKLRGLSIRTLNQYQQQLSRLLEFSDKLPTKPEQIEAVLSTIPGGQETKHCYFSTYRTFYNFLEKRCGVKNPMRYVDAPKVKAKVMPTLEMSDIELLPIFIKNDRDRALIYLILDTGIRSGEAVSLRKEDIKESYIKVRGKVGERTVPISDSVVKLLLDLPTYEDGYVFHGERGRLTRNGVYEIVRKYLTKIGITGAKLGGHRLRHTFGRQYLVLGGDLRSLQLILGHSNISTTTKYANLAIEDVIQKHHKYTPAQLMEVR